MPLWRAVRVIGGIGGAQRSAGLEAPFVGRDRELRVIKELFHASAGESKAHLVSVMGVAGTGKSRLSWEFFKYIDGLAENVRWHRGRCLPYGEGVTFWALAEMVRTRAQIAEGEEPAVAAGEAARRRRGVDPRRRRAPLRRAAPGAPARPRGARAVGAREPLQRLAAVLRAAGRRDADRARVRGHGVGRRGPARLHRAPGRLVEEPSAVRDRARPARADRAAADLGRGQAQLQLALPGAAGDGRDGHPALRTRARAAPTSCAPASASAPRACRCTRSRPCGCCSTAACWCSAGAPTSRPGRSRRSRCPRRCMP